MQREDVRPSLRAQPTGLGNLGGDSRRAVGLNSVVFQVPLDRVSKGDSNSSENLGSPKPLIKFGSRDMSSIKGALSPQSSLSIGGGNMIETQQSFSELSADRALNRRALGGQVPLGSQVLDVSFSQVGILVFHRMMPLLLISSFILVNFCPGSEYTNSICGEPGFFGLYYENASISVTSLALLGSSLVYIIYQCSEYWISKLSLIWSFRGFRVILRVWNFLMETLQPSEQPKPDIPPLNRTLAGIIYLITSVPLVFVAEAVLLFEFPTRLANSRFFSDYEIFRSVILGTLLAVMGCVLGSMVLSYTGVSIVAIVLICVSVTLFLLTVLSVWQMARDEGIGFTVALTNTLFMESSALKLSGLLNNTAPDDMSGGECPYLKTMRYRYTIDMRREGELKEFQIIQLLRNLKTNPTARKLYFASTNKLSVKIGRLAAQQLNKPEMIIYSINDDIRPKNSCEALVLTPDIDRSRALFSTIRDHSLVPWNTSEFHWWSGLPWAPSWRIGARDRTLFPFTGAMALNLCNPELLLELDIGSNEIGDEIAPDLSELIKKSKKLIYLEMGSNLFSNKGMEPIINSIVNHPSIRFVRLSSVLISIADLKTDCVIDLSLPRIYAAAVARCIEALFDCCYGTEDLTGSTLQLAPEPLPWEEKVYMGRIHEVAATEFRRVGRDLYRSLPPEAANNCMRRVAHRLGKFTLPDPHDELDLPPDKCVDGSVIRFPDLVEKRLYTCFLHPEFDLVFIAKIIEKFNHDIEEVDMHGMPLRGDAFKLLLRSLVSKKRIRQLNFTRCSISDPTCVADVIEFIIKSSESFMEINLTGNRAFNGKKDEIWKEISKCNKINTPRIIVDNTL